MNNLVIDRSKWLTGTALRVECGDGAGGELRSPTSGLQCCVGLYGSACGVPAQRMNERSFFVSKEAIEFPELAWLLNGVGGAKNMQEALAEVNDNPKLRPIRREAKIKKLFKEYGDVDVTFTGRYADATRKAKEAVRAAA